MEPLLVKIFAIALALSQVTTTPDAVKTQFDRTRNQEQVTGLLRAGCRHIKKAFDIERINLDDLIATALDDPQAIADENKVFRGINFVDLQGAYRQFCTDQNIAQEAVDLGAVIDFYNKSLADLPDHTKLIGLKLPGTSVVLDGGVSLLRRRSRRTSGAHGFLSPTPRRMCSGPSLRPRTGTSISTRGSTSAA